MLEIASSSLSFWFDHFCLVENFAQAFLNLPNNLTSLSACSLVSKCFDWPNRNAHNDYYRACKKIMQSKLSRDVGTIKNIGTEGSN